MSDLELFQRICAEERALRQARLAQARASDKAEFDLARYRELYRLLDRGDRSAAELEEEYYLDFPTAHTVDEYVRQKIEREQWDSSDMRVDPGT